MRRALVAASLALAFVAMPAEAQFRQVASRIQSESGMARQSLPGFGFARLVVRMMHPEGVHDVRVAVFDAASATRQFDAGEILATTLGSGWQPIVRFSDNRSGEQGTIFAKPSGEDEISLMLFSRDAEDSVLVELRVDPAKLEEIVSEGSRGEFASR